MAIDTHIYNIIIANPKRCSLSGSSSINVTPHVMISQHEILFHAQNYLIIFTVIDLSVLPIKHMPHMDSTLSRGSLTRYPILHI